MCGYDDVFREACHLTVATNVARMRMRLTPMRGRVASM